MSKLNKILIFILIAGGINWGFIGLINFDIISFVFGPIILLTRILYSIIGIAAIYIIFNFKKLK